MKNKAKSLLVHNDTNTNKTTVMVVGEKNFIEKSQEFLKTVCKDNPSCAIVLSAEGKNKNFTVAYEKENFIIVSKKGNTKSARLYGNWNEALNFARKIITRGQYEEKNPRIVLAEYASEN